MLSQANCKVNKNSLKGFTVLISISDIHLYSHPTTNMKEYIIPSIKMSNKIHQIIFIILDCQHSFVKELKFYKEPKSDTK